MDNKVCISCLEDIKNSFVRGSEDCKGEALELHNQYISAIDYAIKALETEGDLISRVYLKKAIYNDLGLGDEECGSDAEYMSGLQDCYNLIDNAPTVNAYTEEQVQEMREEIENYYSDLGQFAYNECGGECYDLRQQQGE